MDHLKDDFKSGGPVSQVPASWFNRVARFINNLVPSDTVRFEKHDDGNATIIEAAPATPPTTSTDISGNSEHDEEPDWPPAEDIPAAIDPLGAEIWKANNNSVGYTEDSVVVVKDLGGHLLFYVKKEYSSDGRLLRVRKYSDGGGVVYVGA